MDKETQSVIDEHVFSKIEQLILENQDANSVIIGALLGGTQLTKSQTAYIGNRIRQSQKLCELMADMGFVFYDKEKYPQNFRERVCR